MRKKAVYCIDCGREVLAIISEREETYAIKGDGPFSILAQVPVCPNCGTELFDEEIETKNQKKLYEQYRRKHGLLSPEEIKAIRRQYGLSQKSFSLLLGFEETAIHRYESGSVQDKVHDTVIRSAQDPKFVQELYRKNPKVVSPRERKLLEKKLELLLFLSRKPDSSGLSDLCRVRKVIAAILFFASNVPDLSREKLHFLLWYTDMLHQKEFGTTITGLRYEKHPLGPVPYCFDVFLRIARNEGIIEIREETEAIRNHNYFPVQGRLAAFIVGKQIESAFGDSRTTFRIRIYPEKNIDVSVFSPSELRVLRFVAQKLGNCKLIELMEKVKEERAFVETGDWRFISPYLARHLTLSLPPNEESS